MHLFLSVLLHILIACALLAYILYFVPVAFLKYFKEDILRKVDAKELAVDLENKDILSQSAITRIDQSEDDVTAASILWKHAKKHFDYDACCKFCDAMIAKNGCPKIKKLGQKMRLELRQSEHHSIV